MPGNAEEFVLWRAGEVEVWELEVEGVVVVVEEVEREVEVRGIEASVLEV